MSYWAKRQEQLLKQMEKDEAALKKRLSSFYDTEFARLDKEIAAYYQKYGVENVIEYRWLMESLPEADKRQLIERMDEFAKAHPEYAHLMPVRESIYKLNRLEGLQYSVKMQQAEIAGKNYSEIQAYLDKQATRGANAAAETLGFGTNFYNNNPDITRLFVNVPWCNGLSFSERIWNDAEKLANYLSTDIAQGFARGDSYDKLVKQLMQRFGNVTRNDAYRLIYTEGTYVAAESSMYPFKEDFEKYRLSIVDDGNACPICRGVAESVFYIKDRQPGVNFPPLHPWCRCLFAIVVDDWDKWLEDYERKYSNGQGRKVKNRLKDTSANSIIKLPRYSEAVIPESKFLEYALNPVKDSNKAYAFKEALGYDLSNCKDLIENIRNHLSEFEAKAKDDLGWGIRYEVVMTLKGPNGKTAKVLTAWIDDKSNGQMRLTSAYVDKE